MKIIMLISSFYPLLGGAETQALRLSKRLIEKGHNIEVITRWHKGLEKVEFIEGIKVIRLKVTDIGKLAPLIYMLKTIYYIFRHRKSIDIIHAHALSAPGLTAAFASFITKIPSIAKIAGGGDENGCEIKRIYYKKNMGKYRVAFMKRYISKFIAISKSIQKDLLDVNVPENKILFLPNGIDVSGYSDKMNKKLLASQLCLPANKFLFLYAGRLEKVKGIDILLSAWKRIDTELKKKCYLIILGEGSLNLEVDDQTVGFIGRVENVKEYMMASNAFILPSRYEGLSNALLEAMASQLPIIASNVGGNPDLIIDNFSGYLFPKEDIDKLSSLLTKIITDFISGEKDRYKELGLNAKRIVKEKFDLKVIANRYIELYQILALKQK